MMDDSLSFCTKHPGYINRPVPWSDDQGAHLIKIWRALLASQNGDGVDGSELPESGNTLGRVLTEFVPARSRVLIIGAGRGQEIQHANSRGYDATGISLGSMNIDIAKEAGVNLLFIDAHCSLLAAVSFDAVVGLQVLEHSSAPIVLVLEAARVLREGGIVAFETPNSAQHTGGRLLHHVLCPTPRQARGLLEKAGFLDVKQFGGGAEIADADIDRGDLPFDVLTVGRRATSEELLLFDPVVRELLSV